MKRIVRFFCLPLVASALLCCSKEAVDVTETAPVEGRTISGEDSRQWASDVLVFSGVYENDYGSRAAIDLSGAEEAAVAFEDKDEALVYVPATGKSGKYVYNIASGLFEPATDDDVIVVGNNIAYVYYPFAEFALDGSDVKFTMPGAVGAGSAADLGDKLPLGGVIPAGAKVGSNPCATFKSIGSILKVSLTSPAAEGETITSVELSGSGVSITGTGKVTWSEDTASGVPVLSALEGGAGTLTVACPAGKHLQSGSYQDFFFFLPPSGDFADMKIKVVFGKTVGETSYLPYKEVTRNMTLSLERNRVYEVKGAIGHFSGGDGSVAYPYIIATADDFKAIAPLANANVSFFRSSGVNYKQTTDIDFEDADLSGCMIGTKDYAFQGLYDGAGLSNFTLSGIPEGGDKDGIALFKNVYGATLKNIAVSGASITGRKFTAGLVGYAAGAALVIQNCSASDITLTTAVDYGAAGLVGGMYAGTVTGCTVRNLTIVNSADAAHNYFGGLFCNVNGSLTISGCSLEGSTTLSGSGKMGYVGGIAARLANAGSEITGCTNNSAIVATGDYVGGIAAIFENGKITGCSNLGDITSEGQYVGGIVGLQKSSSSYAEIKGCRSIAALSGSADVAGIAGRVTWGVITDCFAKGSVTGGINVGGVVGYAYSVNGNVAVLNCLSSVDVTTNASGNTHSGGVIGRATSSATRYVYIGNCAGLNNAVTATEENAVRFGAFTGFTNSEAGDGTNTPNRVRIWNCYTLVDDSNFQCANTGATADVGGFVGRMGTASDLGDCYFINDGSKSTYNGTTYKNITKTTADVIGGSGNIAVNPTRQGLNLDDTFLNVLNRCTYASNGTTRLTAFTNYPMCDWTMTGAGGEILSHPVPVTLVALGEGFYE